MEEEEIHTLVENLMDYVHADPFQIPTPAANRAYDALRDSKDERMLKYLHIVFKKGRRAQQKGFSLLCMFNTLEARMIIIALVKGEYPVSKTIRRAAIEKLEKMLEELAGVNETNRALAASVVSSDRIDKHAERHNDTAYVRALVAALGDPDASIRNQAVRALYKTNNPIAAEPLCRILQDTDLSNRIAAANALKGIEGDTFHALEESLSDRSESVREVVDTSLIARYNMRGLFAIIHRGRKVFDGELHDAMLQGFSNMREAALFFHVMHNMGMIDGMLRDRAFKEALTMFRESDLAFEKMDIESTARVLVDFFLKYPGIELECWEALRRLGVHRLESVENPTAREILASLDGEGEEEKLNAVLRAVSLMIVKQGRYPEAHPIILKARKMLLFPDRLKRMIKDINENPLDYRQGALFAQVSVLILDVDKEIFKETRREGRQRSLMRRSMRSGEARMRTRAA